LNSNGSIRGLKEVSKMIDENTLCVIVSSPANATGYMEPAEDIAKIAIKH